MPPETTTSPNIPASLLQLWQNMSLDPALWQQRSLPWFAEARVQVRERDRYGRGQSMNDATWKAWQAMRAEAQRAGIPLEIISAYRSWDAQRLLWLRKRDRGLSDREILQWSAPPGLSEHHTGRALDLACGEETVLQAEFAQTAAYAWLREHAARFGFRESYPPGNPQGFQPEPWHWCWHP